MISNRMNLAVGRCDDGWLEAALDILRVQGLVIVPGILSETERERTRLGFLRAAEGMREEIGDERLRQARGDYEGQLRLLMKFDPHFYSFLERPELLAILDRFLSPSAVLRFQNGMVIGPATFGRGPWHMNARRVLNSYRAALEVVFAIDDIEGPEFLFALGSHQRTETPAVATLEAAAQPVAVPGGAMLVFDSTLWHRQGEAGSRPQRVFVTHQFTRHFFKPHIDYVRALGDDVVQALPPRTRRLLGWESRVPASLDEFYVHPEERRYLPGQD
jgi:ectoine hydroxylase-related dioxygenase (phytanoyl-CoA dioxygenase family)